MMPSWPAELSRPLADAFQRQRGENRRISQGDQGPPRVRRGMSKSVDTVQIALYLSYDQKARFYRFHDEETEEGALPFLMPGWAKQDQNLLTVDGLYLTDENDVPLLLDDTWPCLFGQSRPNDVVMGVEWRVTFDVIILP